MNNLNHLQGGETVREAVKEVQEKPKESHDHVVKETLDFYLNSPNYTEVYLVRCDECGNDLCLEVLEPTTQHMFMETHHQGRRRITLGFDDAPDGYLLSHRKRLDGTMGYQCVCGNDTIIARPEKSFMRTRMDGSQYLPQLEPHQEAHLRAKMIRSGFTPDTESDGETTRIETFTVERLK